MRQKMASRPRIGLETAAAKEDVLTRGKRVGLQAARGAGGVTISVHTNATEIVAHSRFHQAPGSGVERPADRPASKDARGCGRQVSEPVTALALNGVIGGRTGTAAGCASPLHQARSNLSAFRLAEGFLTTIVARPSARALALQK